MKPFILTLIWTLLFVIAGLIFAYFKYLSRIKDK